MTNTKKLGGIIAPAWNKAFSPKKYTKGREKVIKDYFDLYYESGILRFLTNKIRRKFNIPTLSPCDDLREYVLFDEDNDITETEFYWYENECKYKQRLNSEIRKTLKKLYLPRSAFDFLLYYVFYNEIPHSYPLFDMDLVASLKRGNFPENEFIGYTPRELQYITSLAIALLKKDREKIIFKNITNLEKQEQVKYINEQIKLIPLRIADLKKKYKRINRPLKRLKEDIKTIKLLKKHIKGYTSKDPSFKKTVTRKLKAHEAGLRLYPETKDSKSEMTKIGNRFIQQSKRLKNKFPFLDEFINS